MQLGGIRRFAEEWDLTVAIDLSGQFDPTWEAEAAVARLGERLAILRINASAPSRAAVGRDRVACRALHAAMDRDHFLEVAVAPVKTVPFPITPRVASSGAAARWTISPSAPPSMRELCARGLAATREARLLAGSDATRRPSERSVFARCDGLLVPLMIYRLVY